MEFILNDNNAVTPAESPVVTRFAVRCRCDKMNLVFMTFEFYMAQMDRPNKLWICPRCFEEASFDDDNYELALEDEEQLCPIED